MTLVSAKKVLLDLTDEQKLILDQQSKKLNYLYNKLIEKSISLKDQYIGAKESNNTELAKEIGNQLYSKYGLRDFVPGIKEQHPFLKSVHSSPLKNAAMRLTKSLKSRVKNGTGSPKFQSWKLNWFSLEYEEPNKGWKVINGNQLKISLGERQNLILKLIRPQKGLTKATGVRITKESGRYYAIFTIKKEEKQKKPIVDIAYIDPNLKNLGYLLDTNGKAIEFQNIELKQIDKRIDKLKSKRDKGVRTKNSRTWIRFDQALKKAEMKKRERIKHYLFCITNYLCKNYDLISIGNWTPHTHDHGLGRKANRKIRNNSFVGKFKELLAWTCEKSGKTYLEINETGTTRTCYDCGHVIEGGIHPSIREWACPSCGCVHIRDENAAQNGLSRVMRGGNLPMPCSGLSVIQRCTANFLPKGELEIIADELNQADGAAWAIAV